MSDGSVTHWVRLFQAGDQRALHALWESYFGRLVRLARTRLSGAPRQAADEEDAALSAFDSFCRGVEQGRFPQLLDRDDLWQVLVVLTARKASNLARRERAQKRGEGRAQHLSALAGEESEGPGFAELIGQEPDPAFAAEVGELYRNLLDRLEAPELRVVAVWKMEGRTNEEMARLLDCSLPTVEDRKLRRIRTIWEKEMTT